MFENRADAGRRLAVTLRPEPPALVLALPRGGVPVALEVARAHGLPLDLMLVRKLGVPGQAELAAAAIAGPDGAELVENPEVIAGAGLTRTELEELAEGQRAELRRRRRLYLGDRAPESLAGREVLLVDDGIATGATMRAAVRAARGAGARRVVVAAPVASPEAAALLEREADAVRCLEVPQPFLAVGAHYRDFAQVSDAEVQVLLSTHRTKPG